jgi:hypothetical protein
VKDRDENVGVSYGSCQVTLTKEISLSHIYSMTADTDAEVKPLFVGSDLRESAETNINPLPVSN